MECTVHTKKKKKQTHIISSNVNVIYLSHKETQPQIISAKDTGWYYGFYLFLWTINLWLFNKRELIWFDLINTPVMEDILYGWYFIDMIDMIIMKNQYIYIYIEWQYSRRNIRWWFDSDPRKMNCKINK